MQHQPRPLPTAMAFDRDEWELMVTLPRRVLLAAIAVAPEDDRRAAEGIAGIEAIAAGLSSGSPLVREVVGSIYAEAHGEEDVAGTPDGAVVQTLAACRYATEVLSQRASVEDAAAYRDWVQQIAAAVSGAAHPGEAAAPSAIGLLEDRFLYALGGVLRP